jgi:peroxiredoxin
MRRSLLILAALALPLAAPALANLTTGTKAPDFTAYGSAAGKPFAFKLSEQLKKGPVVLYFFPAADTPGCNAEAHAFAEAMDDYKASGATVIGMTAGNLDKMKQMSEKECAGKFGLAAATPAVIKAYDVLLIGKDGKPTTITSRTSYVIAPNGKVLFVHSDMNPADHVKLTLQAVRKYRAAHKG